jgi:hypothetical protein
MSRFNENTKIKLNNLYILLYIIMEKLRAMKARIIIYGENGGLNLKKNE